MNVHFPTTYSRGFAQFRAKLYKQNKPVKVRTSVWKGEGHGNRQQKMGLSFAQCYPINIKTMEVTFQLQLNRVVFLFSKNLVSTRRRRSCRKQSRPLTLWDRISVWLSLCVYVSACILYMSTLFSSIYTLCNQDGLQRTQEISL